MSNDKIAMEGTVNEDFHTADGSFQTALDSEKFISELFYHCSSSVLQSYSVRQQ